MIESIENGIQLLVTGLCAVIAFYRSGTSGKREWTLLGLFSSALFLGDIYWTLYLVLYQHTPEFTYIPDLSWAASFLFLLLLLLYVRDEDSIKTGKGSRLLWLIPLFCTGMCVYYMQYGSYLINVIYAVLMCLLIWHAVIGLIYIYRSGNSKHKVRWIYYITLLFCAVEYSLWTVSCFFSDESILNPYYWIDLLLSAVFILFIPATKKAVER